MEDIVLYVAIGSVIALGLICLAVEMVKDIVLCCTSIRGMRMTSDKARDTREENMIGFLICDEGIRLAKVIAGMLNIDPDEQKALFCELCVECRKALERYEKKAERLNRRLYTGGK